MWVCGKAAISQMEKLVTTGPLTCEKVTQDLYRQVVATFWVGQMDLDEAMVLKGYA
jgi:endonuclease YncB( thermonuclease family)